jgi:vitamin B12 transport system substrate-binding protein
MHTYKLNKLILLVILLLTSILSNAEYPLPEVRNAQRIIALSPHSVELLYALGVGDRVIGTTDFADYPEAAKKIERVGGYHGIQTERILELEPDLIVAWEGGNKTEDLNMLETLKLPVYRSETKRLRQITEEIKALGILTGTEKKAASLIEEFHKNIDSLQEANKEKEKVRFFYQLWSVPLRTISTGSWINEMLVICGGQNIINDPNLDYPQISLETVLLEEPQAIIIPANHGHDDQSNGKTGTGLDWNKWPEIPAVKNNHIFKINGDILHRFSLRVVEATQILCKTFDNVRKQSI